MRIPVKTSQGAYDIVLERGALKKAGTYLSLQRRVLIVTDTGVPPAYAERVASACKSPVILTIPQGERSKQMETYTLLLETLVKNDFTRTDCVVAVGGGVVGDLAGFAASTYMRGIDFYNIPTTVLSQVDSSIGGKTAIDFMGLKNIVGAFYPPKRVLIDPDTLATLPARQIANGLAESVKMALTSDAELFTLFETGDLREAAVLDTVIARSLAIKKQVVEQDEHESGLRKILNFGHTLAHALESVHGMDTYYHGECVAIGMVPMCAPAVRERLLPVLERLQLPTQLAGDAEALIAACRHDKKMTDEDITVVYVPEIGQYALHAIPFTALETRIREVLDK
ncbi:MAG: 3-dehydroquinate synthase [Clostridia bacterium]|nr:3-dehydroquinate synthase [Clostridia bacterium]